METQFTQLPFFPFPPKALQLIYAAVVVATTTTQASLPSSAPFSSSSPALPSLETENNGLSCQYAELLQTLFPSCRQVRQQPNQVGVQSESVSQKKKHNKTTKKTNILRPPLI